MRHIITGQNIALDQYRSFRGNGYIPTDIREVLGETHGKRINTMVTSVIKHSTDKDFIGMEPHVMEATNRLRDFMFENVYTNTAAKGEEKKAKEILVRLFEYYVKHPEKMPELYFRNTKQESVERCVCDFVSAMTDRAAIEKYRELFIPEVWRG